MFTLSDKKKHVARRFEELLSVDFLMVLDDVAKENGTDHLIHLLPLILRALQSGDTRVIEKVVNMSAIKQASDMTEAIRDIVQSTGEGKSDSDGSEPSSSSHKKGKSEQDSNVSKMLDMMMDTEDKSSYPSDDPDIGKPKIEGSSSGSNTLKNMIAKLSGKTKPKDESDQSQQS